MLRLDRPERRRRGVARLPGLQPQHDEQEQRSRLVDRGLLAAKQRFGAERHGQVERLSHLQPEELRRRDADDRERNALDDKRRPDDTGGSSEAPLPQPIADDGDGAVGTAATPVVGGGECAAEERGDTERREEVAADDQAVDRLRLAVGRQIDALRRPRDGAVERLGAVGGSDPTSRSSSPDPP